MSSIRCRRFCPLCIAIWRLPIPNTERRTVAVASAAVLTSMIYRRRSSDRVKVLVAVGSTSRFRWRRDVASIVATRYSIDMNALRTNWRWRRRRQSDDRLSRMWHRMLRLIASLPYGSWSNVADGPEIPKILCAWLFASAVDVSSVISCLLPTCDSPSFVSLDEFSQV